MEKTSLKDLKIFKNIDFSYVLHPSINFPVSKHTRILKIDPNY